jgi:ATPase subunit of ABC transporter with duplicated ATPase domains
VKKLEKIEKVEPPRRNNKVAFEFKPAPRSGDDVVKLEKVSKSYADLKIYEGLDFLVRRRDRWCVMGVNGAGKSTLLKLVAGATAPDRGAVSMGPSVKLGYFAQHAMDVLDPTKSVWQTLVDAFPRTSEGSLRTLAGCFGFSGDEADKAVRVLSGGERARLVMALMLYDPPNFLVLDEPTNHLDLATKEMLIEALRSYEGTMLFVSHDRHFLAELSNRVLELTPQGPVAYGGGYTEYVARSGHEAPGLRS